MGHRRVFVGRGLTFLPLSDALFGNDWRPGDLITWKLDGHINLTPSEQFSVFSAAIYLYYAFGLRNLWNHIEQKLLFKFWNFRMCGWNMYEALLALNCSLDAAISSIIDSHQSPGHVMTNSWSRAVASFAIFHFGYILLHRVSCELLHNPSTPVTFSSDQFPSP